MSALLAEHGEVLSSSGALRALAEDHAVPEVAGPRHTRQVPNRMFEVCAGSSRFGASIRALSLLVIDSPRVAGGAKLAAVQAEPSVHVLRLMSAPMLRVQSVGVLGSICGKPPSPADSCGHATSVEALVVATEPLAPSPASSVLGSVGCCAKPMTSPASRPCRWRR